MFSLNMLITEFLVENKIKRCGTILMKVRNILIANASERQVHTAPKNGPWSVLFFGSDDFSLESLRSLYNEYKSQSVCRLEVVHTRKEDKRNVVVKYAEEHKIPIKSWPFEDKVANFDIGVVVSFGHLIPSDIIKTFPLGMINVHGSLLPRWRGASPIVYSLMNGDTQTGITIMKIAPHKYDIGDIVAQEQVDIEPHITQPELRCKLAKVGGSLLVKVIHELPSILSYAKRQSEIGITYAHKMKLDLSLVKWDEMSAKNIYDLQRALTGLFPLTTKFGNMKIKIFDVEQIQEIETTCDQSLLTPGFAIFNKKSRLIIVKCKGESWISIKTFGIPGHARMSALDFHNGFICAPRLKVIKFG